MKKDDLNTFKSKHWLLVICIICVVLMGFSLRTDRVNRPFRSIVNYTIVPMQKGMNTIGIWMNDLTKNFETLQELREKNHELQAKVDDLTTKNNMLLQEKYELDRLRELFELDQKYKDYDIITQLAKGMNPIACSRAFDYARKESGRKAVIVILDDFHEEAKSSENTAWHYDTDYEFLKDDSIKQLIIAGPRYLDSFIRLQIAGYGTENLVYEKDLIEATEKLKLDGIDKIFILHDLYAIEETKQIKNKVKELIDKKNNN